MVFSPPADDEVQRRRQAVILEAPHGAMLRFDRPLDLSQAKLGRLVGGELKGPVTIRSEGKQPGPEDDLLVTAAGDLELTEQTVSTPSPVEFHWGPHFGRGHDMLIKLLPGQPLAGKEPSGPNIAGIESFELRHVERLHLDMRQSTAPAAGKPQSVPVEITCRGPFHFDMVGHMATFHDRVEVMKANPYGPSDQLACELLSLYFIPRPKSPARQTSAKPDAAGSSTWRWGGSRPAALRPCSRPAKGSSPGASGSSIACKPTRWRWTAAKKSFCNKARTKFTPAACTTNRPPRGRGILGRVVAQGPGSLHGQSARAARSAVGSRVEGQVCASFPTSGTRSSR